MNITKKNTVEIFVKENPDTINSIESYFSITLNKNLEISIGNSNSITNLHLKKIMKSNEGFIMTIDTSKSICKYKDIFNLGYYIGILSNI